MVTHSHQDHRRPPLDLADYVAAVHRRARIARNREVAYQFRLVGESFTRALAEIANRIDRFLFPPHLPAN